MLEMVFMACPPCDGGQGWSAWPRGANRHITELSIQKPDQKYNSYLSLGSIHGPAAIKKPVTKSRGIAKTDRPLKTPVTIRYPKISRTPYVPVICQAYITKLNVESAYETAPASIATPVTLTANSALLLIVLVSLIVMPDGT